MADIPAFQSQLSYKTFHDFQFGNWDCIIHLHAVRFDLIKPYSNIDRQRFAPQSSHPQKTRRLTWRFGTGESMAHQNTQYELILARFYARRVLAYQRWNLPIKLLFVESKTDREISERCLRGNFIKRNTKQQRTRRSIFLDFLKIRH